MPLALAFVETSAVISLCISKINGEYLSLRFADEIVLFANSTAYLKKYDFVRIPQRKCESVFTYELQENSCNYQ